MFNCSVRILNTVGFIKMNIFDIFKPKIKVVTHSGGFHPDDVFACAALSLWAERQGKKLEIKRTRDEKFFATADFVVDVGMEYDEARNRFDHHQKGGAGMRENGVPYASFGLVWQKFGAEICQSKEIAKMVDEKLVVPIDAHDNGVNISIPNNLNVVEHITGQAILNFNPTWFEDYGSTNQAFKEALAFAKAILQREIAKAKSELEGAKMTKEAIEKQNNSEILVLEKYTDWEAEVSRHKDIKFVVYPHRNGQDWCVQTGRDNPQDFTSDRANFPVGWQGLRDGELANVIGVRDAVFCTNGGWYAVARSKDSALKMAQMALAQN